MRSAHPQQPSLITQVDDAYLANKSLINLPKGVASVPGSFGGHLCLCWATGADDFGGDHGWRVWECHEQKKSEWIGWFLRACRNSGLEWENNHHFLSRCSFFVNLHDPLWTSVLVGPQVDVCIGIGGFILTLWRDVTHSWWIFGQWKNPTDELLALAEGVCCVWEMGSWMNQRIYKVLQMKIKSSNSM